jgi:hypothetical protein
VVGRGRSGRGYDRGRGFGGRSAGRPALNNVTTDINEVLRLGMAA